VNEPRDEVLALIPARGGSKSIPRKNLKRLGGHPLIAWTIAAARASSRLSRVIVSSDDEEIRAVARDYGAEAPFARPAELARDETTDLPVFLHALRWLEEERGLAPKVVVHLRPTSPFRPPGLVDQALAVLAAAPEADSLRAVTFPDQNPHKMWTRDGRWLHPLRGDFCDELYNRPRQELPEVLWQTGHIDVVRRECLLGLRSMTGRRILPLLVDARYALDLDTPRQWAYAEWRLRAHELPLARPLTAEELCRSSQAPARSGASAGIDGRPRAR
jgi:N-acylneuraminate cytidylyltransferase